MTCAKNKTYQDDGLVKPCWSCRKKIASEIHHLFPQSKLNKKLYPDYIHDPRNLQKLCYSCHHDKPVAHYSELEFCRVMGIEPRSKEAAGKKLRK